jgi:glycosyltransferase involved in cell wall biosynthesis
MFSIIIPTWNRFLFLDRCLNSLKNQKFKNFEVVIIDNCSQDDTKNLIEKYKTLDLNYKKFANNGILAKSRNLGINLAKYDYIAFLDDDDWWTNDKLLINYNLIKKNNYSFLYHDLHVIKKNKIYWNALKGKKIHKPYLLNLLINGNPILNSSVVVLKSLLEDINLINENPELAANEDFNSWIKIFEKNPKVKYIRKTLGYYQWHDVGMSRKNMYRSSSVCAYEFSRKFDIKNKKKIFSRLIYIKISYYLNIKKKIKIKYFFYCLQNLPSNMKLKLLVKFFKYLFINFLIYKNK